ncbi:MAG: hypothetical protein GX958_08030 [Desulfitobacterium sp.]|nr:hypothetical protein [Desulfitobacterium sp.]
MEFKKEIETRGITRLCHFTRSQKDVHILTSETGIKAVDFIEKDIYDVNDPLRLDGKKSYVNCSIQYPNYWYWKEGTIPWSAGSRDVQNYFNAGGNGVAMRILPHIFGKEQVPNEVIQEVLQNGILTHGHPRALIGATLYADALICLSETDKTLGYGELVDILLKRKDIWSEIPRFKNYDNWLGVAEKILKSKYTEIWDSVVMETVELLEIAKEGLNKGALDIGCGVLEKLGCFDRKINGAGTITAVAAIYLASKYASNPQQGLLEAAYLNNADTDTLASMLGGLLGMLHGTEFISVSWVNVQDYEYLKQFAYFKPEKRGIINNIKDVLDYKNPAFNSKLKQMKPGDSIVALPFNKLTLKEKRGNKTHVNGAVVHTLRLVSEEGQSIFIKTFEKATETKQPQGSTSGHGILFSNKDPNIRDLSSDSRRVAKPVLDANKVRSLANLLPESMPSDQCLFFISDILAELERSVTGKINEEGFVVLLDRWREHNITKWHIERVLKVIFNY